MYDAAAWPSAHVAVRPLPNVADGSLSVDPEITLKVKAFNLQIDFVFEDGTHDPGFAGGVLAHLAPTLASGAAVLCHDYCRPTAAASVAAAFDAAVVGGRGVLIAPSNCGLGYGRAAALAAAA